MPSSNGTPELQSEHDVDLDWSRYEGIDGDCVDGDFSALDLSVGHSSSESFLGRSPSKINGYNSPIAENGHYLSSIGMTNGQKMVMDLGPMLELYTKEIPRDAKLMPDEAIPSTATGADNDVIIQGRRPIFSESEESNIAVQLKQWKEQGMKYTRLDVVKMASEYAVQLGKRPQGRPLTVKWFRSFLTRHPECYIRKSRKIKIEKPEKQHFHQLESVLSAYSVKESPHCIFSLMEVPLHMLRTNETLLNGGSGASQHHQLNMDANNGLYPSSVLFCGSAAGQALPPYLIFSGKTWDRSLLLGSTPGTGGIVSLSGRVNPEVLMSFLREHFLSQAPGRAGDTLVLLLDASVARSLSQAVLDLGSAFKVVFVTAQTALSPHIHPMAAGCCDTFQRELAIEMEQPHYIARLGQSSALSILASSLIEFICRLYHRHMSAENLHASFRKAGIFPFNPSVCSRRYGSAVVQSPGRQEMVRAPITEGSREDESGDCHVYMNMNMNDEELI